MKPNRSPAARSSSIAWIAYSSPYFFVRLWVLITRQESGVGGQESVVGDRKNNAIPGPSVGVRGLRKRRISSRHTGTRIAGRCAVEGGRHTECACYGRRSSDQHRLTEHD